VSHNAESRQDQDGGEQDAEITNPPKRRRGKRAINRSVSVPIAHRGDTTSERAEPVQLPHPQLHRGVRQIRVVVNKRPTKLDSHCVQTIGSDESQ